MENLWKRNFLPLIFTRFSDFGTFLSFQQFFPHPFSTGLFNFVWNFPDFFLRFSLFPTIVAHFSPHSIFLLPRKTFLNFPHSAFSTSLQLFHKVLNTCGKICGKIEKDLGRGKTSAATCRTAISLFVKKRVWDLYPDGAESALPQIDVFKGKILRLIPRGWSLCKSYLYISFWANKGAFWKALSWRVFF